MTHYGDIKVINGFQIEPVSCITGGSPCQDLSIAGKRAGLSGERSGLFMEMIRIIKEMMEATNGAYPKFVVWENVPGAFSSNNGEDFRAVLEEFAHIKQPNIIIPRPPKGKWSKAGAISGDGWSLAWRQLDSQYFGVAQRRKRIALILDLGGQRAGEVLFERTSLSRNPDPCIPTWQEATGAAGNRIAGNDRMVGEEQNAYTLKIRGGCAGGGKGALVQTEKIGTLSTLQDQTLFQPVPILNDQGGGVMGVSYNVTGTLRAAEHGHQPIVFENHAQPVVLESNQVHATASQTGICSTLPASMGLGGGYVPMVTERKIFDARGNGDGQIVPTITGDHESRITDYTALAVERKPTASYGIGNGQAHAYASKERSGTLDTMHDAQAVAIEYSGCLNPWDTQARRVYGEGGTFPALPSRESAGGNQQAVLAGQRTRWIVRRLTPTECERLQGYPDGWTDIGEWTDTKGKKHKPADSPRYKALGNSIALPQWFWIAQKMKPYMGDGAKLGSLFDGIGGFPLVWETTYGVGTAAWASEIEEFPIAVTKKHFPE